MKFFLKDLLFGFSIITPIIFIIFSFLAMFNYLCTILSDEVITFSLSFVIFLLVSWMVGFVWRR